MGIESLFGTLGFSVPLAYIDPGIVSLAIQSFCVLLFSAATGFLFGPWRWLASFFRRKDKSSEQ
jgi:hypothetical protein